MGKGRLWALQGNEMQAVGLMSKGNAGKISGIEVVTPEATNILVWFGSLYVFISP